MSRTKRLIELINKAPIKKTFGMELSYNANKEAIFFMRHNPHLEHALNDTHGGIIITLLDNAGWFTVSAQYETWIATVELHSNLLEPAKKEDLIAKGCLIRLGKSLAVAEMKVKSITERLVATGSAIFSVTSIPFSWDCQLNH